MASATTLATALPAGKSRPSLASLSRIASPTTRLAMSRGTVGAAGATVGAGAGRGASPIAPGTVQTGRPMPGGNPLPGSRSAGVSYSLVGGPWTTGPGSTGPGSTGPGSTTVPSMGLPFRRGS